MKKMENSGVGCVKCVVNSEQSALDGKRSGFLIAVFTRNLSGRLRVYDVYHYDYPARLTPTEIRVMCFFRSFAF